MSVVAPEPVVFRLPRVLMAPRFAPPLKSSVNASPLPLKTAGVAELFNVVPASVIGVAARNTVPVYACAPLVVILPLSVVAPEPVVFRLPNVVIDPRVAPLLKFRVNASLLPLNTAGVAELFSVVPVSVIGVAASSTVPL